MYMYNAKLSFAKCIIIFGDCFRILYASFFTFGADYVKASMLF